MHYKCLVGKFEIQDELGLDNEAFETIKKLANHYPISPRRLGRVFELAVYTRHFDEMDNLYEIFKSISERDERLTKTVSVSLIVAGRYLLRKKETARALEQFKRAATANPEAPLVMREVIFALARHNLHDAAVDFLKRYPEAHIDTDDYRVSKFIVESGSHSTLAVISDGRKLLEEGVIHPEMMKVMIIRYKEFGKPDAAEDVAIRATKNYPELKSEFFNLLKKDKAA